MARKLTKQEYSKLAVRGTDDDDDVVRDPGKGVSRKRAAPAPSSHVRTAAAANVNMNDGVDEDTRFTTDADDDDESDTSGMLFPRRRAPALFMAALVFMTVLFLLIVYLVVRRNQIKNALDSSSALRTQDDAFPDDALAMIDDRVDPCDDFYQFACGKWIAESEIPPEKSSVYASFTTVHDQNEAVLRDIVAENWPFIGELYSSCMNLSAINATGTAPLRSALDQIERVQTKRELFALAGRLSQTGPDFLTSLAVAADAKDATTYALYASQSGLTLPDPAYYLDAAQASGVRDAFTTFVSTMFTLAGANDSSLTTQVLGFEHALAQTFVPKEELTDPIATYNLVNVSAAAQQYPLLVGAYMNGTGIYDRLVHTSHATVVIETPAYFAAAEALVASTSLATLRAVLTFQYVQHFAPTLSEPFVAAAFALFKRALSGQQQRSPRWKVCLRHVTSSFPTLVGKLYFLKQFDVASEARAIELVAQIERAMAQRLEALPWLDASTRAAALAKLARVTNLIGHASKHEQFPFALEPDALAANVQVLAQHAFEKAVAKIGARVDRDEWFMTAADVNAYYNPAANQIVFPAGILQPPFFGRALDAARNYGAIGSIMGHELTHGFDSQGRNYDGDGNLVSWWTNATEREFHARAACLVDQYDAFAVASALDPSRVLGHVNGNFTLGENIADNGGVTLAFRAFERAQTMSNSSSPAPAPVAAVEDVTDRDRVRRMAPATANKLFFLSFAQAFCAKSSDEAMVRRLSTDPHAPEQWRVNGVMMNSDDFARTFACPRGANMNPVTKCKLW